MITYIVLFVNKTWESYIGVKSDKFKERWRDSQLTLSLHTSRLKKPENLSPSLSLPVSILIWVHQNL